MDKVIDRIEMMNGFVMIEPEISSNVRKSGLVDNSSAMREYRFKTAKVVKSFKKDDGSDAVKIGSEIVYDKVREEQFQDPEGQTRHLIRFDYIALIM